MKNSFLYRAFRLYYDGFRSIIIAIKLFVIFVVLKLFFFPNFISRHAEKGGEADFVATQLCPEESAPDE